MSVTISSRPRVRRSGYSIDLPAHMAECDANYLKLEKIFPGLVEDQELLLSLAVGHRTLIVRFSVLERTPYTTFLAIDQRDPSASQDLAFARPQLKVRMYHDAKSAEVVEYQNQRRFQAVYDYPNVGMRQRDEKAQLNRFLGEFLSACLSHGLAAQSHENAPS